MNTQPDPFRGFYWHSKSYYARFDGSGRCTTLGGRHTLDEIMIGLYFRDGGAESEFAIRWTELGGEAIARLEVFEDAWGVLARFPDMLKKLEELAGSKPSPRVIADMLIALGVEDITQYQRKD